MFSEAMKKTEALDEIRRCAGDQFDPELAAAFIDMIEKN